MSYTTLTDPHRRGTSNTKPSPVDGGAVTGRIEQGHGRFLQEHDRSVVFCRCRDERGPVVQVLTT